MSVAEPDGILLSLDEIGQLVSHRGHPAETLNQLVNLIQRQFASDVCSVYLLESNRSHLMLAATVGLRAECVGRVRMGLKEGLAGLVAEQMRPVMTDDADKHPRYKYFPETGEEDFRSFLGVPLVERGILQGVLVLQTTEARRFSPSELETLVDTAAHVAPLVSELRTKDQVSTPVYDRLRSLSRNLWWCWDHETNEVFRELAPVRWRELEHNAVALLNETPLSDIEQRVKELVLHSRINYAYRRLREYRESKTTWGARHAGVLWARPVAYFSAEFGIHESMPIYSGGLGVLAGDHVKSASDLGIPLVGVGLFYSQGYFHQRVDRDGQQHEQYIANQPAQLPLELVLDERGKPMSVSIDTRSGVIHARLWKLKVGRNLLVLLDSDVEGNRPEDRELTARLYGGDHRVRIRQELLLGVGGVKALNALKISPGVLHLNEGHSAFATLEVIHHHMSCEGISFEQALRRVAPRVVFTTHTPVPAGHDRFSGELIEEHLGPLRDRLEISYDRLMALGRVDPYNPGEDFCMTVLALKLSRCANAVSSLHGQVSREMWTSLFPGRTEDEVPIGHITNGVHVLSWLAPQMHELYDRHLGTEWVRHGGEPQVWEAIESVDVGELGETHQSLKSRLIDFVRRRSVREAERRGDPTEYVDRLQRGLSLDTLTIGFARRFATYKRADLIFRDIERLVEVMNDAKRPIQFVFAGKAHPHDVPGKQILKRIAQLARDPRFAGKLVFIEDYDINTCRHLVQGVDVWLNNPRRPLEASGTSGQKIVLNGGLNLSILDGWWAEAYEGNNGFAIGNGETHSSVDIHDERDARSLFEVLRDEVVPLYYERDRDGLPHGWIQRMKNAIRTLGWRFHSDRMVMDYVTKCYIPAAGGTSSDMSQVR
ncbi:MAG: alpha-glucan family phosphorylase [Planctomycetaceae bacterium]|nr:alpha-glucan family phosphorylase [Planctomycetaceae bacterium]